MPKSSARRSIALLLTLASGPLLALSGCAYGELRQVLRAQVASETSCPDVTVENSPAYQPGYKPGQYRVKGCGVERLYDCPKDTGLVSYGAKVCTYTDTKAPPAPAPAADEPPPLDEGADAPAEPLPEPAESE
ncbi:MAG TPA: hypothetical protein VJR89_22200 [Polyangiales bacterium]|nr:hypothetical protein [Polyangiales bacterium]